MFRLIHRFLWAPAPPELKPGLAQMFYDMQLLIAVAVILLVVVVVMAGYAGMMDQKATPAATIQLVATFSDTSAGAIEVYFTAQSTSLPREITLRTWQNGKITSEATYLPAIVEADSSSPIIKGYQANEDNLSGRPRPAVRGDSARAK